MAEVRVDRKQKNIMRENLEKVLALHKDLDEKINVFYKETENDEYRNFWRDLKTKNDENIQVVSTYMVRKCNR